MEVYALGFNEEYDVFIQSRILSSSDVERNRLKNGLGFAELRFLKYVWWPAFHQFENLHPEYEVQDYQGTTRFIDFAYVRPNFRVAIEIDGLATHWQNISKWEFTQHWRRQNQLILDGWYVLRFTMVDLDESPRACQQLLQQLLGRWEKNASGLSELSVHEREIVRYVMQAVHPITPQEASTVLGVSAKWGRGILHGLVEKQWLQPASGKTRVTSYRLHPSKTHVRV